MQPVAASSSVGDCSYDSVGTLVFNETSSLLDSNYDRLTDDGIVFVFSEDGADAGQYSDEAVPLWARDGNYFGSGSLLVNDDEANGLDYGQDAALLNIIDSYTGGSGHIVFDESADQGYSLSGNFSKLETWVTGEGYTIAASNDLTADLDGADALLVTIPGQEHTPEAIDEIASFAAGGNPVFFFNEADSWDTDDLNFLAEELDLAFRFDDDEVTDEPGWEWNDWPITRSYDDDMYPEWFAYREGMGFAPGNEYTAEIVDVVDGDTFDVEIVGGFQDGEEETFRNLGMDTPETGSTQNNSDEWRGIEDEKHLDDWGKTTNDYAQDNFAAGDVVTFWVDENEYPPRGTYGRLLAFHTYPEGHADEDVTYNLDVVEKGYAKPYNSSYGPHPDFTAAYWDAYESGRRIWEPADAEGTDEVWNNAVETLRFRAATPIANATADDTAVWSEDGEPVVGMDEANGVCLVGGLMNADAWEESDDENFVFNVNLAQHLSGDVTEDMLLIEGGHGQFLASYDFSFEGKERYHRFIEGLDAMWFQAVNEVSEAYLDVTKGRHAVVITPPDIDFCYTVEEVDALKGFIADGGAVILKANTEVDGRSVTLLNDLAAELGTDLQFDGAAIGDVATQQFNTDYDLFSAYETDGSSGDDPARFDATIDTYDEEVTEGDDVTVEYTIENSGDESDTQDIVFEVDSEQEDVRETVSLSSGDTFSDTFTYTTVEGDAPEITVAVVTEDDSAERTVTVNEDGGSGSGGVTLGADPDTEETASYHTWTFEDPSDDFGGEVDEITVEYPTGTSMDGLTDEDVVVYMDRDGDGSVDEIQVNSGEYAGSDATFDLDGRYDTSVEGEVRVEIDGVVNPQAGEYQATIALAGDDDHAADADFVVTEDDGGETSDPVIEQFDVSTRSSGRWFRVDNDWAVSDDDGALATVETELLDGGSVVDTDSSDVSGSSAAGEHEVRTDGEADEVRMIVSDEHGNETSDTEPL